MPSLLKMKYLFNCQFKLIRSFKRRYEPFAIPNFLLVWKLFGQLDANMGSWNQSFNSGEYYELSGHFNRTLRRTAEHGSLSLHVKSTENAEQCMGRAWSWWKRWKAKSTMAGGTLCKRYECVHTLWAKIKRRDWISVYWENVWCWSLADWVFLQTSMLGFPFTT